MLKLDLFRIQKYCVILLTEKVLRQLEEGGSRQSGTAVDIVVYNGYVQVEVHYTWGIFYTQL